MKHLSESRTGWGWAWTLALPVLCALALLTGCSPASLLNSFVPDDGYVVHEDLRYGTANRQMLDVYVPEASPVAAPVVMFFYGGSWRNGSRQSYRFIGEALARKGFVVVVPDYRLYPEVRFPAFVEDGAQAVRWVADNAQAYGGDPDRIVLMGHSAGAHVAALLAFDERYLDQANVPRSKIRALMGVAGPYSFDPLAYRTTRRVFAGLEDPNQARPITFVDGAGVKTLLLHGAEDTTVLPRNSEEFAARIEESGGEAQLLEYPDIGHIKIILSLAAPFRGRDTVYEDTIAFLKSL